MVAKVWRPRPWGYLWGMPRLSVHPPILNTLLAVAAFAPLIAAVGCLPPVLTPLVPLPPLPSVDAATGSAAPRPDSTRDLATETEVVETAQRVFGAEPLANHGDAEAVVPSWDLNVRSYETHQAVERFVSLYSGPRRHYTASRLSRGTRYEPMIRAKFRAAGMPEDLYYLAFVESAFDVHAMSRAGAGGMWQFTAGTARSLGLRVNRWVDDRRDPARATDAAVRYLAAFYKQFGSYYLAVAAYNAGPVAIARGLRQLGTALGGSLADRPTDDHFFALSDRDLLRAETRTFVPQLIAVALVAKDTARFRLAIASTEPLVYDSVLVAPGTSLGALAKAAQLPPDVLTELNPALLRGVASPDAEEWVRVPSGTDSLVWRAYEALAPDERAGSRLESPTARTRTASRTAPRTHVVKPGESLSVIARRYSTTTAALKRANGLKSDRIRAGQRLRIR